VTADAGTVVIAIDWPEAQTAYRIVESAQQNFIEERHASEISSIAETISILETHATAVRETIDSTIEEIRASSTGRAAPRRAAPAGAPASKDDGELAQIRALLTAKRRASPTSRSTATSAWPRCTRSSQSRGAPTDRSTRP